MRRLLTVMGLFAMVASCGFAPKPKDGKLPCDNGCPTGYVCRADNRCWLVNVPGVDSGADGPAIAKDIAVVELGGSDSLGSVDGVSPGAVDVAEGEDIGAKLDSPSAAVESGSGGVSGTGGSANGGGVSESGLGGSGGATVSMGGTAPSGTGGSGGISGSGGMVAVGSGGAIGLDAASDLTSRTDTHCTANQHVASHACVACAPGSTNAAGDDATGADTSCNATLCPANQHVASHACVACLSGSTNAAGDDARGPDTPCDAGLCASNQRVSNHTCVACSPGSMRPAGDDASGADTSCTDTLCAANQHVESHACVACTAGSTRPAYDDATGGDTSCTDTLCAADQHVVSHACVACTAGSTRPANDNATGGDTSCTDTLCAANYHVASHACVACAPGSTRPASDDATGADTACTDTFCAANYRVASHACVACAAGSTRPTGDDATGVDTACADTLCAANYHVASHACVACAAASTRPAGDDATGADTACTGAGLFPCDTTVPVLESGTGQPANPLVSALQYPTGLWVKGTKVYFTETAAFNTSYGGAQRLSVHDTTTKTTTILVSNLATSNCTHCQSVVVASNGTIYLGSYTSSIPGTSGVIYSLNPTTFVATPVVTLGTSIMDMYMDAADNILVVGDGGTSPYMLPAGHYTSPVTLNTTLAANWALTEGNCTLFGGDISAHAIASLSSAGTVNNSWGPGVAVTGLSASSSYLYYVNFSMNMIQRVSLSTGGNPQTVASGLNSPNNVRYHPATGALYFVEAGTQANKYQDGILKVIYPSP
jgi:hypothetical protein